MSGSSGLTSALKAVLPKTVVAAISRFRYRQFFRRYTPRVVTQNYGGYNLTVELPDPLAEGWYAHDWAMPPEILLLGKSKLRTGATVFDLGAHQCVMAMLLAKIVGTTGQVLAVEGSSLNARAAKRNIQLNGIANCMVINAVAAAASGQVQFGSVGNGRVIGHGAQGLFSSAEQQPAYSVDDLARIHGNPDVIYVDVEGSECDVLAGSAETFKTKPDYFIEVHQGFGLEDRGGSVEKLLSYFIDGYQCYAAKDDVSNDYTIWNDFEPLMDSVYPSGRFFFVAIAS